MVTKDFHRSYRKFWIVLFILGDIYRFHELIDFHKERGDIRSPVKIYENFTMYRERSSETNKTLKNTKAQ